MLKHHLSLTTSKLIRHLIWRGLEPEAIATFVSEGVPSHPEMFFILEFYLLERIEIIGEITDRQPILPPYLDKTDSPLDEITRLKSQQTQDRKDKLPTEPRRLREICLDLGFEVAVEDTQTLSKLAIALKHAISKGILKADVIRTTSANQYRHCRQLTDFVKNWFKSL